MSMDRPSGLVDRTSSSQAKIALFRSLFRGREDVYPRRFESRKTGSTILAFRLGSRPTFSCFHPKSYPRGVAPRTPLHALSRAASPARFRLRQGFGGRAEAPSARRRAVRVDSRRPAEGNELTDAAVPQVQPAPGENS